MHVSSTIYRSSRIELRGQEEFSTADHSAYLQKGRVEVWKRGIRQAEEFLKNTLAGSPVQDKRRLQPGGSWSHGWGASLNGKWDGTGCAGMARCPLPMIQSRATRPP